MMKWGRGHDTCEQQQKKNHRSKRLGFLASGTFRPSFVVLAADLCGAQPVIKSGFAELSLGASAAPRRILGASPRSGGS